VTATIQIDCTHVVIKGIEYLFGKTIQEGTHLVGKDRLFRPTDHELIYKGETAEGVPHGKGRFYNLDQERVVGCFSLKDKFSAGAFPKRKGMRYKGEFKCGVADGTGVLESADGGFKYEGGFHNGLEHGYGKITLNGTVTYEGYFQNGLKHGKGCLIVPGTNHRYTGDFVNGLKDGRGEEILEGGAFYRGQYKANLFHGMGEYYYADNRRYIGEFKNGIPDGSGRQYFPDGRLFEGVFRGGAKVSGMWGSWSSH
jgi:hypothetical protein